MRTPSRPAAVWALLVLLAAEFLLVVAAVILLLVELLVETPASLPTAVALVVLVAIGAVWAGAILAGAWRGAAWTRAGGIVLQILLFAAGVGALQGALGSPVWGWPIVAVAIVGVVLLLSRPVVAWTHRAPRP